MEILYNKAKWNLMSVMLFLTFKKVYILFDSIFFLPITDQYGQRLICATHDNFADTSDLSEWGFGDAVLLRKNMSCVEVQAIRFSAGF